MINFNKGILSLILLSCSLSLISQISRGTLLDQEAPLSTASFFTADQLNLEALRKTTSFLTNRDIKTYRGYQIPKRKKAFMRHVKHLSEILEQHYQEQKKSTAEIHEWVYELYLLESSLKQKTLARARTKVTLGEKINLVLDSYRSRRVFRYKIPEASREIYEIPESPYYHPLSKERSPHKQFGYLAKQKKVDAKKNMVVLFKDLSLSGSAPKIGTHDLDLDNEWSLKWGDEVHTDVVGSRIFAALGYDVDHPYFYGRDKLTLVFDEPTEVNNAEELIQALKKIYKVDIGPFISNYGTVSEEMAKTQKKLTAFIGKPYVRFVKCAIEARPDRVKRIGSFIPHTPLNQDRRELKASLLAHHFIGNWDTKESNTLLTTVHSGNYNYRISAVFSDLGTSMGVSLKTLNRDFKVGLVNKLPWEVVKKKGNKLKFNNRINSILPAYKKANYHDLLWMAEKIALLDETMLRKIIEKAQWPEPIAELYFHKMASRRASILKAFNIQDPHPIKFDRKLNLYELGELVVKEGKLIKDYQADRNPESFLKKKGRFRNYGN
ncbi:MAG: hypothetical protein R8P61_22440 [Bacteroidia bacterium]|nr:hypothetical protein [Bacteroidia bacterium]